MFYMHLQAVKRYHTTCWLNLTHVPRGYIIDTTLHVHWTWLTYREVTSFRKIPLGHVYLAHHNGTHLYVLAIINNFLQIKQTCMNQLNEGLHYIYIRCTTLTGKCWTPSSSCSPRRGTGWRLDSTTVLSLVAMATESSPYAVMTLSLL